MPAIVEKGPVYDTKQRASDTIRLTEQPSESISLHLLLVQFARQSFYR
jgi:hypothetical protein